jgi:hypothetical protein
VYLANGDYLHAEYADWMATHPPDAEQRLPENIAKRRAESPGQLAPLERPGANRR